jgi:hypothetical protein
MSRTEASLTHLAMTSFKAPAPDPNNWSREWCDYTDYESTFLNMKSGLQILCHGFMANDFKDVSCVGVASSLRRTVQAYKLQITIPRIKHWNKENKQICRIDCAYCKYNKLYTRFTMSPAILYLMTTPSSAIVFSITSSLSAISFRRNYLHSGFKYLDNFWLLQHAYWWHSLKQTGTYKSQNILA